MKSIMICLSCLLLFTLPVFAQEMSADDILKKVDELLDIRNSEQEIEMQVYRDQELRTTYRMSLQYQDSDYLLTETLYPPRNKGEKSLHTKDNMWLYLPKINKVMRVSESNSFSNSDFSNMDIMKSELGKDYTPTLIGIETYNNEEAYKLELTAKTEDVPYAKIHYWIRKKDLYPLQREYYTFSGNLLKRMVMQTKTDIRKGLPDEFIMTSVLEKDKYTILRYLKIETGKTFPPETFNKDSLAKR
jgi:outer membrane lipoprotein-sorting protein